MTRRRRDRDLVVQREAVVRILRERARCAAAEASRWCSRIGDVDLGVLLKPGMAGELEEASAAPGRDGRGHARTGSFRGSLLELLLHPDAVRVQLQRLRERLPRFCILIVLAQADPEPQVRLGVLRIELDGFPEIGDRLRRAAPELRRAGSSCRRPAPPRPTTISARAPWPWRARPWPSGRSSGRLMTSVMAWP